MNYLKLLLKEVKSHELVVGAILIIYILAGVSYTRFFSRL